MGGGIRQLYYTIIAYQTAAHWRRRRIAVTMLMNGIQNPLQIYVKKGVCAILNAIHNSH